jgi:hypothetical protein
LLAAAQRVAAIVYISVTVIVDTVADFVATLNLSNTFRRPGTIRTGLPSLFARRRPIAARFSCASIAVTVLVRDAVAILIPIAAVADFVLGRDSSLALGGLVVPDTRVTREYSLFACPNIAAARSRD